MTEPATSPIVPPEVLDRLRHLSDEWRNVDANERASFQTWFLKFCEALEVPGPVPPNDDYRFELPVKVVDRDGTESSNFIDCWKAGHFALEAKATGEAKAERALRRAFGQVRNYAAHVFGDSPPFLMVVDVPRTLIVWDRWSGSYGDYAAGKRIALLTLHERPEEVALLRDILTNPSARDPRGRAQAVTRGIAGRLADLAARLEDRGHDPERVARFLMRCVFSCFAEDVGLLPQRLFERTLETARTAGGPEHVGRVLTQLWQTMDAGGSFGADLVHRFNGHFFKTVESLPLLPDDIDLLIDAARYDWSRVEPSIFGTLLVRALDPAERHRLGAEYTPREYIERLVEPTVVEPIRERWTAVQGSVLQLEESGKKKDVETALKTLIDFHTWMRGLSFLDPACGSGNFLYVTMAAVKRVELEVLHEIQRLSGGQGGLVLDEVHPRQFHGIEIKPWAREIAELTLWIGYHQFWREAHGGRTPPDPILEDTGTLECRDAILAWDEKRHVPERDETDLTPRVLHPISGDLVPDQAARRAYVEHDNPRRAAWPRADFIIGNPPYVGGTSMREALGSGYVDALRRVYKATVGDGADLVMYWWSRVAAEIATGRSVRAGLLTTNSITQIRNRQVVERAIAAGTRIVWAVADHPWIDDADSASVRVAMTVLSTESIPPRLVEVDADGRETISRPVVALNGSLAASPAISAAATEPMNANEGLSSNGFNLRGAGFIVTRDEADFLLRTEPRNREVLRPYLNGRDLAARPRNVFLVDFNTMSRAEASVFPQLFDLVRTRVEPERIVKKEAAARDSWWQLWRTRPAFRSAVRGLRRYIATPETAKHRFFVFLDASFAPDHSLVVVASEHSVHLGVLSSAVHVAWALAVGGTLEDRPRYNKSVCFNPFPFPDPSPSLRIRIGDIAERLDQHRNDALARDERITMTGMYNVVEKMRSGEPLTAKERVIHEIAACGLLKDIHDRLDTAVAEAYGWPWPMPVEEILKRLVALHNERVVEEKRGLVRWLRPDYQLPRFSAVEPAASFAFEDAVATKGKKSTKKAVLPAPPTAAWPETAVAQISAISTLLSLRPQSTAQLVTAFTGAKRDLVQRHLDTLALMGEVTLGPDGRYGSSTRAG